MQTPETQLAYLGFRLIPPGTALRPYVQSYWTCHSQTPLRVFREEYLHPRGGFGLVFNFGDRLFLDGQPLAGPIVLDGANTVSRKMGFVGQVDLLGVRFHEGEAYPFLGLPLSELRDETNLLAALNPASWLPLCERLAQADSLPARLERLEEWLVSRLSLGKARDALIPPSLALLRDEVGCVPIPELARTFAISQRQLERLYQTQVGMSPRQYAQLVRVEAARLSLKQLHTDSAAALAADLGYYDQSHFIREFCAVVGMTPHAYRQRRLRRSQPANS